MSEQPNVSRFCIYTILQRQKLDTFFQDDGTGNGQEQKVWKEGQRLFLESRKDGEQMPVLFGAADTGSGLIYYAFLTDVEVDEETDTKYEFAQLTKIENDPPLSSLKLKSTNKPLSNDYIRPYALCYTPSLVRWKDA